MFGREKGIKDGRRLAWEEGAGCQEGQNGRVITGCYLAGTNFQFINRGCSLMGIGCRGLWWAVFYWEDCGTRHRARHERVGPRFEPG